MATRSRSPRSKFPFSARPAATVKALVIVYRNLLGQIDKIEQDKPALISAEDAKQRMAELEAVIRFLDPSVKFDRLTSRHERRRGPREDDRKFRSSVLAILRQADDWQTCKQVRLALVANRPDLAADKAYMRKLAGKVQDAMHGLYRKGAVEPAQPTDFTGRKGPQRWRLSSLLR